MVSWSNCWIIVNWKPIVFCILYKEYIMEITMVLDNKYYSNCLYNYIIYHSQINFQITWGNYSSPRIQISIKFRSFILHISFLYLTLFNIYSWYIESSIFKTDSNISVKFSLYKIEHFSNS